MSTRPLSSRRNDELVPIENPHPEPRIAYQSFEPRKLNNLTLVDGKTFTPPTIDAPQALTLTNEPKANVERYDTLRKTEVRHAP